MAELDKELKSIEKGDAWNETDEVVQIEVKKPLDKVVPVRLSSDVWVRLRKEARELGVGPTTLARMWILTLLRLLDDQEKSESLRMLLANTLQKRFVVSLTEREAKIIEYIAQGYSTELIADKLGLSEEIIKSQIGLILLKIHTRQEQSESMGVEPQQV